MPCKTRFYTDKQGRKRPISEKKGKRSYHGQTDDPYWIRGAIEEPGSYRASVKRRYGKKGFTSKGTIKREVIAKDAQKKGKLGKQARLARTLKEVNR